MNTLKVVIVEICGFKIRISRSFVENLTPWSRAKTPTQKNIESSLNMYSHYNTNVIIMSKIALKKWLYDFMTLFPFEIWE
jgi:hypothetical protein